MKKKNIFIRGGIIAIFVLIPLVSGHAIDNTEPLAQPVLPMVRAMGGAFTAVANDENAIFYNPAGYALIDEGIISVFSLESWIACFFIHSDPSEKILEGFIKSS